MSKVVAIDIPDEVYKQFEAMAREQKVPVQTVIRKELSKAAYANMVSLALKKRRQ